MRGSRPVSRDLVSSVDPSSTTMSSQSDQDCARMLAMARWMMSARL